jgi:hypothetical protein
MLDEVLEPSKRIWRHAPQQRAHQWLKQPPNHTALELQFGLAGEQRSLAVRETDQRLAARLINGIPKPS